MTDPVDLTGKVRVWWDADAATYDDSSDHGWAVASPARRAAWNAALHRLLPGRGSRVLDVGAGTGFLSLAAARLGHRVTALDLSGGMLERLAEHAAREGLQVDVVQGGAEEPPAGAGPESVTWATRFFVPLSSSIIVGSTESEIMGSIRSSKMLVQRDDQPAAQVRPARVAHLVTREGG